jgi:hypothetical protein
MQFKRRDALKFLGCTTLAAFADPVFAKAKLQNEFPTIE